MKYLRVKNWENFQHYKDRNPPWIKLHRDLLRDYDFICLQDASKLHLMLVWLLASQLDNKLPADADFIKKQIGVSGEINFKELIDKGFLIDDSGVLARCKQSAMLETETEAKTETEADKTSLSGSPAANANSDEIPAKPMSIPYQKICNAMNNMLITKYRVTDNFRKLVKARWQDGFREDDFTAVCERQLEAWGSDPKMQAYLRPETLFGTKMNSYLGGHRGTVVSDRERINRAAASAFLGGLSQ